MTGFGLLGHLHKLARASGVTALVDAAAVPYMDQAREALAAGYVSGGTRRNLDLVRPHLDRRGIAEDELLCSPTPKPPAVSSSPARCPATRWSASCSSAATASRSWCADPCSRSALRLAVRAGMHRPALVPSLPLGQDGRGTRRGKPRACIVCTRPTSSAANLCPRLAAPPDPG